MTAISAGSVSSSDLRRCQSRFEQRYPCSQIDHDGREKLIQQSDIDAAVEALTGTEEEFICYLARHSTTAVSSDQ